MRDHDNPLSDAAFDQLLRDTLNTADGSNDQLSPFLMEKIKGFSALPQELPPQPWYAGLSAFFRPAAGHGMRTSLTGLAALCLVVIGLGYSLPNSTPSALPQGQPASLTPLNGAELPESGLIDGDYWPSWSNLEVEGDLS